jgi:hypothetical protein
MSAQISMSSEEKITNEKNENQITMNENEDKITEDGITQRLLNDSNEIHVNSKDIQFTDLDNELLNNNLEKIENTTNGNYQQQDQQVVDIAKDLDEVYPTIDQEIILKIVSGIKCYNQSKTDCFQRAIEQVEKFIQLMDVYGNTDELKEKIKKIIMTFHRT